MPEYSYPGVYVVEIESGVEPVAGVSTSTAELIGRDCIDRLRRLSDPSRADWTGQDTHDPGVALLELLSYVADLLAAHGELLSEEAMLHSSRLAASALALSSRRDLPCGSALKSVQFHEGCLLREEDPERAQKGRGRSLHIAAVRTAK